MIVTSYLASLSAAIGSAAIGSAGSAHAAGATALFAVDNGSASASALYLFTSVVADALVSAAELTLLVNLSARPVTVVADYLGPQVPLGAPTQAAALPSLRSLANQRALAFSSRPSVLPISVSRIGAMPTMPSRLRSSAFTLCARYSTR